MRRRRLQGRQHFVLMASKRFSDSAGTKSYAVSFRTQVSSLSEARICQIAMADSRIGKHFLVAFEGGRVDCAIHVGFTQLTGFSFTRLFEVFEDDTGELVIVSVELKDTAPVVEKGVIYWHIKFTQEQANVCQAVIVSSARDFDFIAHIPMHYFRHHLDNVPVNGISLRSKFVQPQWQLQQLFAFSSEWTLFIASVMDVGKGFFSARAARTGSNVWWVIITLVDEMNC